MPLLSRYAAARKIGYFVDPIPKDARILEIGCGGGALRDYLRANGWTHYTGLDLFPPADVVGDVRDWQKLGLEAHSFDVILAFEVVEHVDCFEACRQLLKPGGKLKMTTPVPHMDWFMKLLEAFGLNQKRTSPHDHLVYLKDVPGFGHKEVRTVAGLAQWGIFTA